MTSITLDFFDDQGYGYILSYYRNGVNHAVRIDDADDNTLRDSIAASIVAMREWVQEEE
jgi:hypothetical protein